MFTSIKQFCAGRIECPICKIAEFLGLLNEPGTANIFEEMEHDIKIMSPIIEYSKGF